MTLETPVKYIVAVSGGIDSVVMLDLFAKQQIAIVVAHVDHGIRDESHEDEVFVRELANKYGVEYVSTRLELGALSSEDAARQARYVWLEEVRERYGAEAIATAHHQDDVIETMCLNLLRGTGWRGLCSLRTTSSRVRPLLGWSKAQVVGYAIDHGLGWREDSTNESLRYTRNRIRTQVITRLDSVQRQQFLDLYEAQKKLRRDIRGEVAAIEARCVSEGELGRYHVTMVDEAVAVELVRRWLGESLERRRFRDLLLFMKTARPGARWSLNEAHYIRAKARGFIVERRSD